MVSYLQKKLAEEYHHLNLWYFVCFLFGIVLYFSINVTISPYYIGLIALSIIAIIFSLKKKTLSFKFGAYCFAFFMFGMGVSIVRMHFIDTKPIKRITTTELTGRVYSNKPTVRGNQIVLTDVQGKYLTVNKVRINISNILAKELNKGDVIKIKAKLFPPQSSVLPGTYDFGFYMYMSGIAASGYALGKPEIVTRDDRFFYGMLANIRKQIYHRLIDVMGAEQGNFVAAILIGQTKAISPKVASKMRDSGVAHILSVSGLHLSLVAMIFFVFARILLNCFDYFAYNTNIKLIAAIISIIGSFCYLLISGSNIAATRAFIMTVVFIISVMIDRIPYPMRSVIIAAFIILIVSPEYIFHPSFQLSFSAVLCLISGYEFYLRNKLFFGSSKGIFASIKFYIFTNIYSSFLASIVTAPFVIYHFYKFATYSVAMNLIAVPLMSFFMMPLSLFALLLMPIGLDSYILPVIGFFVDIIIKSAGFFTSLPLSVWHVGHITSYSLIIFSLGFFWLCLWQTKWRFWGFVIMLLSLIMMVATPRPDFIYDHQLKLVGRKNHFGKLEIYSEKKIPDFIRDYWVSWYGQKDAIIIKKKNLYKNKIFDLNNNKQVALAYRQCMDADIQIITSKKLKCGNSPLIIDNDNLWQAKTILLYCNNDKCSVKYKCPYNY